MGREALELGADPDVKGTFLKEPLFVEAVFWGQVETVWLLVKSGVDVGVRNRAGQRPLEFAEWLSYERRKEAVRAVYRHNYEEQGDAEDQERAKKYFEEELTVIAAILRGAEG